MKTHVAGLLVALTLGTGAAAEDLVPANFTQKTDALGFRWDIDPSGAVSDGTNDCFDGGLHLLVNGSQFQPRGRPMMSRDGREYVLSGQMAGANVTRRVLVDTQRGFARYLEVLTNAGGATAQVQVTILTRLGGSALQTLTTSGAAFAGQLGRKDVGLVTIGSNNRPCVLFLLAGLRSKTKPTIQVEGNRTYRFNYTLGLRPQATVSLCHLVAQRHGVSSASAPGLVKSFYKTRLVKVEIPRELARTVVNFRTGLGAGGEGMGNMLQAVGELSANFGVERGKGDVLVIDATAHLEGTAAARGLVVHTAHGQAEVGLDEVALLFGGAAVGRPMRLYLRNGEVLAGRVQADGLKLRTASGMEISLSPERVNLLLTRVAPGDGKPAAEAAAYLQTHLGDRLALAGEPPLALQAATAWGELKVSLDDLRQATYVREPQPGLRLSLVDGSRLPVVLRGGEIAATTLRFGPIRLSPSAVAGLARVEEKPQDEADGEEIDAPHCVLAGESIVVGPIATTRLHLIAATGLTPLDAAQIRKLERADADERVLPSFTVELQEGGTLSGRLEERLLPIRAGQSVLRVPVEHLVTFVAPERKDEPKEGAGERGKKAEEDAGAEATSAAAAADPETAARIKAIERALAHVEAQAKQLEAAGASDADKQAVQRRRAMLLGSLDDLRKRAASLRGAKPAAPQPR